MAKAIVTNTPTKHEQTSLHDALERRRKYPRIVIDVPVIIKPEKATAVTAIVHDISIDGIQVRCDRGTTKQLHPTGKFIKEGKGSLVEVEFDLQIKAQPEKITITCQIYYFTVISKTEFAFGLLFRKYSDKSAALVDRFIMDQIIPVEDKVRTFLEEPRSQKEISTYMNMQGNEVVEVIDRLQVKGEIISFGEGHDVKHLKLSAAFTTIFNTLERLEQRLERLEPAKDGKGK